MLGQCRNGESRRSARQIRACVLVLTLLASAALTGCGGSSGAAGPKPSPTSAKPAPSPSRTPLAGGLPGMPPVYDPHNVYSEAAANMLAPQVRGDKPLVYVPHNDSGDVWVIDPTSYQVVGKYPAGREIQHVVPSWDMRTLYATDDVGNQLLPFDAHTGKVGNVIPVVDPYNMYSTPDGRYAISVAEAQRALVWYDPKTWQQKDRTEVPSCMGVDHADFSVDGRIAVFTCEFAGAVAVVDIASHKLLRIINMPTRHTHMGPQDIKMAPDGSAYFVADCDAGGLWVLDGAATKVDRFIPTGQCAHGLYFDRPARRMFVTNRMNGTISVLDAYTGKPETTWKIPGGGSPDMGNLTADGSQLWISGRYDNKVYVFDTSTGAVIRTIPVGSGPHGLCVWPQPGRYSLGHTGITR